MSRLDISMHTQIVPIRQYTMILHKQELFDPIVSDPVTFIIV